MESLCILYCIQEANNSNNGRAAHSAWRNYDDFNEYFWFVLKRAFLLFLPVPFFFFVFYFILLHMYRSRSCFELSWPPADGSKFLRQPAKRKRVS